MAFWTRAFCPDASSSVGMSKRMGQSYATGEYPVPEPVAKLLRLCVRLKLNADDVK